MSQDLAENPFVPSLISWNLTQQCNLRCPQCYLDATSLPDEVELSSAEALGMIDQIAELSPGAMVVFFGGEPLLRSDLPYLVRHASVRGLMPVLGTNGTLLDGGAIGELVACGLAGAGISLDSPAGRSLPLKVFLKYYQLSNSILHIMSFGWPQARALLAGRANALLRNFFATYLTSGFFSLQP